MSDHTEAASAVPPSPDAETATLVPPPAEDRLECAVPGDAPTERPRTRWAAIIWGAVLAAIGGLALWITVSPDRRTALADWTVSLSPAAAAAYVVLAIGAVALVAGLVGILRRAQRALDRRRTTDGPAA